MALVRFWTRVYTSRLRPAVRDARRAEIESDLWEGAHDADAPGGRGLRELTRLFCGMSDDVAWRLEQEDTMAVSMKSKMAIVGVIAAGLAVCIALASSLSQVSMPEVAPVPAQAGIGYLPAPPPPPPVSVGQQPVDGPRLYGRTSYTVVDGSASPIKIKDAQPVYPPIAVSYGLRGEVVLEATVDQHGRVVNARIVRSIPVLDHAAINAVRQWQFEPRVVNGTAAPMVIEVKAVFDQSAGG